MATATVVRPDAVGPATRRGEEPAGSQPPGRPGWIRVVHGSLAGSVMALLFLCMSLTPSLLPRAWYLQGLIGGISAATGYGVGVALASAVPRRRRPRAGRRAWWIVVGLGAAAVAVSLRQSWIWQAEIRELMSQPRQAPYEYAGVLVLSVGIFAALVALARGLRVVVRYLSHLLVRWLSPRSAGVVGVVAVAVLLASTVDAVVSDGVMGRVDSIASSINNTTGPDVLRPTSPARSGSVESLVSWDSLGMQGRSFVAGGPTVAQLREFSAAEPKQPIRVYAGLASAPTIPDIAGLAVRELSRTGAYSRAVLCVITTTGTGWVDPVAAAALEYMYRGDTALVGIQYSYLPSWVAFFGKRDVARTAGRELFEQVYAQWSALPSSQRPKLLVFGESLGSLGSEAAFDGVDDIRARTDGVLWVGPTNANTLWAWLVAQRDPGTGEVLPAYRAGETVQFANSASDLEGSTASWRRPRVVYLQHASDPITWWSPGLLAHRPDWLKEPRGEDVLPAMRWYPFVTFWQVTADLVFALETPPGHGHRFQDATVAAWAAIAAPDGWSPAETRRLAEHLRH